MHKMEEKINVSLVIIVFIIFLFLVAIGMTDDSNHNYPSDRFL